MYEEEKAQLLEIEKAIVVDALSTLKRVVQKMQSTKNVRFDLDALEEAVKACHRVRSLIGVPGSVA